MSQRATLDDVTRLESETSSLKARLGGGVIAGRYTHNIHIRSSLSMTYRF